MTVRNWPSCSTASGSHAPMGGGGRAPAQTGSLPTRATAIPGVGTCCANGRSHISYPSARISGRGVPCGPAARSPSTGRSTHVATSWNGASIGSNSGVGWLLATRSAPLTTAQWWSSRPLSSGSTRDVSDSPSCTR